MFTQKVDGDISIALVQESFAVKYSELVTDQIDYLSQWLAWPPHCTSEQDFRLFVQRVLHEYAEGKTITCAIVYRGEIVGNCSCFNIDYDTKCLEIGYWLSKHHQGNGIVTRVVKHLIDFAFNELNMEKVQLSAAIENRASRSVAERSGMTLEGVITNQEKIGERILDHAIYGIHRNR